MNIFKRIKAVLRLREAVRKANEEHKKTGERYYVMPAGSPKTGKLIIMDRKNFRIMKQKGYISRKVLVRDLEQECFYCTSYRNGKDELPDFIINMKRRQYFDWLNSSSK